MFGLQLINIQSCEKIRTVSKMKCLLVQIGHQQIKSQHFPFGVLIFFRMTVVTNCDQCLLTFVHFGSMA